MNNDDDDDDDDDCYEGSTLQQNCIHTQNYTKLFAKDVAFFYLLNTMSLVASSLQV